MLHDATLLGIHYAWEARSLTINVRTSDGERELRFGEVVRVEIPQLQPWGPSVSVNTVRVTPGESASSRIEVRMQSGDVIVIECNVDRDRLSLE